MVGSSGSGKSHLAKHEASKFKHVVTVNTGGVFENAVEVPFEDAEKSVQKGGMVVFDDIINATAEQMAVLKRMCLYVKRHQQVEVRRVAV